MYATWLSVVQARFDHPYTSFLFYGMDSAGDFIPVKQLREKYNRPRHEVPYDPQDERSGDGDAWRDVIQTVDMILLQMQILVVCMNRMYVYIECLLFGWGWFLVDFGG